MVTARQFRSNRSRSIAWLFLLLCVPACAGRGCSCTRAPQPSASVVTPAADTSSGSQDASAADPHTTAEPVAPADPDAGGAPPADAPPPGPTLADLLAFILTNPTVAALRTRLGESPHGPIALPAARDYHRCRSGADVTACDALEGDEAADCREVASQVSARARGTTGWALPDDSLRACTSAGATEAACRRYATAIETGTVGHCAGLPEILRDCEAAASGQASRCPRGGERGCPERVAAFAALRAGLTEAARDSSRRGIAARGAIDPSSCASTLRRALTPTR